MKHVLLILLAITPALSYTAETPKTASQRAKHALLATAHGAGALIYGIIGLHLCAFAAGAANVSIEGFKDHSLITGFTDPRLCFSGSSARSKAFDMGVYRAQGIIAAVGAAAFADTLAYVGYRFLRATNRFVQNASEHAKHMVS